MMSWPWNLLFSFFSQIGTKQWRYYDFGPKVVPPLVCLPGTAGTADVYYKQIMSLSMKVVSLIFYGFFIITVTLFCVNMLEIHIHSFFFFALF
jgi:maspardin